MPRSTIQSGKGALGAIGSVRNFVHVLKEIRFDEIRESAEQVPSLLVLAPLHTDAEAVAQVLVGENHRAQVESVRLDGNPRLVGGYDAVVIFSADGGQLAEDSVTTISTSGTNVAVVAFPGTDPRSLRAARETREAILARTPERATAFGRHIPAFRAAAVEAIINETSRANAQFALMSNIPAMIPVVGSLASAGADFIVLTKNQMMMMYKIAAAHDQDLRDQLKILRELLPVVGAGLFWRTVARELASFLPFAAGTIPKVAIAYTGTVVAGRAADFYYRAGRKPTREQMRAYYRQATEALKNLPFLPGNEAERTNQDRPMA
jgi:uncharacterized protein (DUF697 family)